MIKVNAIQCNKCGDTIFSRAHYDCRSCSCGKIFIDGGFDYMRTGGEVNIYRILEIKTTKQELYDDWNLARDKFGLVRNLRIKENKVKLPKIEVCLKKMDHLEKGASLGKPREKKCNCSVCKLANKKINKEKNLFARFLDTIFADAKKHPEKLHTSNEVWDKEWKEILGIAIKKKSDKKLIESIKRGIMDLKKGRYIDVKDLDKFFKEL